jgi:hypothetical protein
MKNKLIMLINAWLGTFFKNKKPRYYDGIKVQNLNKKLTECGLLL